MKFNKKNYDIQFKKTLDQKRIYIDIDREIGEEFDMLLKSNNHTRMSVLFPVILDYIKKNKKK